MHALSTRNDNPSHASRPFDAERDGFVIAEGAGALIFEEYEHAKARGAKIYCEVVGGGMSADAYHMTANHTGTVYTFQNFLRISPLECDKIDFIFLTPAIRVKHSHIEVQSPENILSDHNPHWADLEF